MLHQWNTVTLYDRYPQIMKFQGFSELENPKILSFGCSTGEEIESIKKYIPKSEVFGVDINLNCVSVCIEKFGKQYIRHYNDFIKDYDNFDIIFAMSVFCKWEDTEFVDDCSLLYPFTQFDTAISMLDKRLNVGGFMVVYNSNFMFKDASIYHKYESVKYGSDSGFVHKFNINNIKVKEQYPYTIFKKLQ